MFEKSYGISVYVAHGKLTILLSYIISLLILLLRNKLRIL